MELYDRLQHREVQLFQTQLGVLQDYRETIFCKTQFAAGLQFTHVINWQNMARLSFATGMDIIIEFDFVLLLSTKVHPTWISRPNHCM